MADVPGHEMLMSLLSQILYCSSTSMKGKPTKKKICTHVTLQGKRNKMVTNM